MGYTTEFRGEFNLNFSALTEEQENITIKLINGLANTRRMKRDLSKIEDILPQPVRKYGTEGEFYYDTSDASDMGQIKDTSILEYNQPPSTQPGLWLQWIIGPNNNTLEWDGNEKFYYYAEWLEYLIEKIFKPGKILISGSVDYRGEDWDDHGTITIDNDYNITTT